MGIKVFDFDIMARDAGATTTAQLIATGRKFLIEFENHIRRCLPVILESTLTGKSVLKRIEFAKQHGFRVELHYLDVCRLQLAAYRVGQRVRLGGHDIPAQVQQRRFPRSRENILPAALLCDETVIWDNSGRKGPVPLVRLLASAPPVFAGDPPGWVRQLTAGYLAAIKTG